MWANTLLRCASAGARCKEKRTKENEEQRRRRWKCVEEAERILIVLATGDYTLYICNCEKVCAILSWERAPQLCK